MAMWSAAEVLLFCAWLAAAAATAQTADPAQVEAGMQVYKTAVCEFCHGGKGNGGEAHDEYYGRGIEPGPSLVLTKLDRERMIELLSCGTPAGKMPQYLVTAWTLDRRCYGKVAADLPLEDRPLRPSPYADPPGPYSTLTASQIEAVVTYVQEVYQGKGMTLPNCIKYYGPTSRACDLLR